MIDIQGNKLRAQYMFRDVTLFADIVKNISLIFAELNHYLPFA